MLYWHLPWCLSVGRETVRQHDVLTSSPVQSLFTTPVHSTHFPSFSSWGTKCCVPLHGNSHSRGPETKVLQWQTTGEWDSVREWEGWSYCNQSVRDRYNTLPYQMYLFCSNSPPIWENRSIYLSSLNHTVPLPLWVCVCGGSVGGSIRTLARFLLFTVYPSPPHTNTRRGCLPACDPPRVSEWPPGCWHYHWGEEERNARSAVAWRWFRFGCCAGSCW